MFLVFSRTLLWGIVGYGVWDLESTVGLQIMIVEAGIEDFGI